MEAAWLARMRWRRRGAWLWPAFVLATVADGLIAHALPPVGESQSVMGGVLIGCFLNLFAIAVLSGPLGLLLRRRRQDLPKVVARDYAGTATIATFSVILLLLGIRNHPMIDAHHRAMMEAIARAQAWIGDRAPAEFRRNVEHVSTFVIEPGNIYRTCVPSDRRSRSFCVVVKVHMPLARSVTFDGYESNAVFGAGAGG